jgi:hypothetical protein
VTKKLGRRPVKVMVSVSSQCPMSETAIAEGFGFVLLECLGIAILLLQ